VKALKFKTLFFCILFTSLNVSSSDYALVSVGYESNILVKIADDSKERKRGLMFLNKLTDTNGLLFIYPKSKIVTMWMHNTFLPLDIIFIDKTSKVLSIKEGIPLSKELISSNYAVNAVLEIPKGCSKKLNIKQNDKITWTRINKEKKKNIRYYHCLDK